MNKLIGLYFYMLKIYIKLYLITRNHNVTSKTCNDIGINT